MQAPEFRIKHVGINTPSGEAAEALTGELCGLFELKRGHENDAHIFAGDLFEVMKHEKIGTHGHIALQTSDVEGAIAYFAEKGISVLESTIRRDAQGRITFAYLDLEVGGFAFHLTV